MAPWVVRWLAGVSAIAAALIAPPGAVIGQAQPVEAMSSGELSLALRKLAVLGSALYVAAHPDDENTALLTYLSKERLVRVGYLSLTRGDGGQNLIGSEAGDPLGVIRTQELLAARRIDGAEQFFTRAVDFGYSKSPDETLEIWGREQVLADVVRVIREFRPDVIITRFPSDGGGHGHHTASAILAEEAFTAAADPTRFPEQLATLSPWQAKRILWNAWRPRIEDRDPSLPNLLSVDLGRYNPHLGRSYAELAAESRSMHKSQGFGSAARRGQHLDYFEHRAGTRADTDLFEGIDLGWSRLAGGDRVRRLLAQAVQDYQAERPESIVPLLARAYRALDGLGDDPWVSVKRGELLEVIRSVAGIWIEAIAEAPSASPGSEVRVRALVLNRSRTPVSLERVEMPLGAEARAPSAEAVGETVAARPNPRNRDLTYNQPVEVEATVSLPQGLGYTQPYWLRQKPGKGLFEVLDASLIGRSEDVPRLEVRCVLLIEGERLVYSVPVLYRWTDRVHGERYRRFEVAPPVTARFDREVYVFPDARPKEVRVFATSGDAPVAGSVRLALPEGWRAEPESHSVSLPEGEEEVAFRFIVHPGAAPATGTASAVVETRDGSYSHGLIRIDYPHIPVQTLYPPAEVPVVRVDIQRSGKEVGYVMGSGDQIPEALRQVGYRVTPLDEQDLESESLTRFDAIVLGVRAYNTRPRLARQQGRLLDYVHAGGVLVVQYNTTGSPLEDRPGPHPFQISRDRVAVEDAPIRVLAPQHPLLNRPNRIEASDFDGWVQERGLYFPDRWDENYETVLSTNDPGESPKDGGLLYARHGRGVFIYTGYSWFRQLPAGVPGAYRLFVNLVSGGR